MVEAEIFHTQMETVVKLSFHEAQFQKSPNFHGIEMLSSVPYI